MGKVSTVIAGFKCSQWASLFDSSTSVLPIIVKSNWLNCSTINQSWFSIPSWPASIVLEKQKFRFNDAGLLPRFWEYGGIFFNWGLLHSSDSGLYQAENELYTIYIHIDFPEIWSFIEQELSVCARITNVHLPSNEIKHMELYSDSYS